MATTLIRYKGYADILTSIILTVRPALIYESLPARTVSNYTGLHISNATIAPGFHQAIASMVASIGVGEVLASYVGPAASPIIFYMNLTWGLLSVVTCFTPTAWKMASATIAYSAINHIGFSLALLFVHRGIVSITGFKERSEKEKGKAL